MRVSTRQTKNGLTEVYPTFIIRSPSQHLMIRGGDFYAFPKTFVFTIVADPTPEVNPNA